jgi:hypothetical protein
MTLQEKRCLFTKLACELITWINTHDWVTERAEAGEAALSDDYDVECAVDEWTVHSPRWAQDRVHDPDGLHPHGLAVDLLIYINGDYITDGSHPIWKRINTHARSMDAQFGLGLSFNDANHLSYGE